MARLILMKKAEVAVTEEKKGKQLAVKENNISAMKDFYKNNYQVPTANNEIVMTPEVVPPVEEPKVEPAIENTIINPNPASAENNTITQQPIEMAINQQENIIAEPQSSITQPEVIEETPAIMETEPLKEEVLIEQPKEESAIDLSSSVPNLESETVSPKESVELNLEPENSLKNTLITEENEMDPELKEIKDRLDKVIEDLNNYKKKIKILETEVNQNLEKSREVLKDTQAAAQIMSIQQQRQQQITDEVNGGGTLENDPSRILQKNIA